MQTLPTLKFKPVSPRRPKIQLQRREYFHTETIQGRGGRRHLHVLFSLTSFSHKYIQRNTVHTCLRCSETVQGKLSGELYLRVSPNQCSLTLPAQSWGRRFRKSLAASWFSAWKERYSMDCPDLGILDAPYQLFLWGNNKFRYVATLSKAALRSKNYR